MAARLPYRWKGWNCRGPAKYRDMLLDVGTEEMALGEVADAGAGHPKTYVTFKEKAAVQTANGVPR